VGSGDRLAECTKSKGATSQARPKGATIPSEPPPGPETLLEEAEQEMDRVEEAAREAAHDGAVDPDVLEVVARMLLDEPDGALGPSASTPFSMKVASRSWWRSTSSIT